MDEINPTWLGTVLAKHSRDQSIVNVISVTTEPAVAACENYSSSIVRATIKVVLGSGTITTRKVIMKTLLDNITEDVEREIYDVFNIEGIVYKNILSTYETLINEHCLGFNKFWADCMLASHKLIIFEDLRTSGFTLGPRRTGFDPVHVKLVVENLARLHSLSLVSISTGVVFPKILPRYLMIDSPSGISMIKTFLTALADAIHNSWSSDWSRVEKKVRSMIEDVVQTMTDLCHQEHKLSVMNHGDCWASNMLFKYNSQGTPIEQKFVDFQITHYNSYAWDLAYFFYTSIHPETLKDHSDSFIEMYSREFARNLELMGHDASKAPTIDDIKSELNRLLPYSLIISCTIMPVVVNPKDIKLDLNDLISDSSKAGLLFKDKEFEKTMKLMLTHFVNLGLL